MLTQAINQTGSWANQNIEITPDWYLEQLAIKIQSLNWKNVKMDVKRFLKAEELEMLESWGVEFFLSQLEQLEQTFLMETPKTKIGC